MAGKHPCTFPSPSSRIGVTAIPPQIVLAADDGRKPRSRHSVRISPKVGVRARDAAALSGGFVSVALVEIAAGRWAGRGVFDHLAWRAGAAVAIDLEGLPEETEIRFFGSKNSEFRTLHGQIHPCPAGDGKFGGYRIGAGSVLVAGDRGETAKVEIYLPASVEGGFPIRAPKIQHLTQSFQYPDEDLFSDWKLWLLQHRCQMGYRARQFSAAVAKILFSDTENSYLCTGTLLNDNDSSQLDSLFHDGEPPPVDPIRRQYHR